MGKLRDQMQRDMEIRNLSSRTKRCYLDWMIRFAGFFRKPPDVLGDEEIKVSAFPASGEESLSVSNEPGL